MHYELSETDLLDLYDPRKQQSGGGEFYRANVLRQRGAGFGSFLKGVGRFLLPLVRKHVLPHAASAARNVMGDIIEGKNVGQALKQHGIEGIKEVGKSIMGAQSGSGIRRKRTSSSSRLVPVKHKKRRHKQQRIKSIFD
jgi:hypothetical protein